MLVQPYVFFEGRCEEAFEYYREKLGATQIMLMRFRELPKPHPPDAIPPGGEDKVMHMSFRIGDTVINASDGRCHGSAEFRGFSLVIHVDTEQEADRYYRALEPDGQVLMPIGKTFFSPRYGMLVDKFGVMWMVIVRSPEMEK